MGVFYGTAVKDGRRIISVTMGSSSSSQRFIDTKVLLNVKESDVKVVLTDDNLNYTFNDVYNVGGYMCISVDEFANVYNLVWNSNERASYTNTSR